MAKGTKERHAVRTVHCEFRADTDGGDGNTLVGLAVPFGVTTRIDDPWEGSFDEEFIRGAFRRSLGMRTPVLQFDHGTHPMVGSIPLGRFERIEEVRDGLRVEAPLFDNWLIEPVRDAIAGGAISGMSIRFRPLALDVILPEARTDVEGAEVPLQRITEAELVELGPVIFPAYPTTEVDIRSIDLTNEDDRRRLARALLGAVPTAGDDSSISSPGTASEVGAPADGSGPTDGHPDCSTPQRTRRAMMLRLHELTRT